MVQLSLKFHFISQAIENVFAIGKKIPMGPCFCQPPGGFSTHNASEMEHFAGLDQVTCKVRLRRSTFQLIEFSNSRRKWMES
jgi:hypothetical protein